MMNKLNILANIPSGTMKASDVSKIFGMELTKTEADELGDVYNNAPNIDLNIIVYVIPTNEIRMNLSGLQVQKEKLAASTNFLLQNNWHQASPIRHLFILDSFYKNNKQIHLESDLENLREISVNGLNIEGGE